MFLLNSRLSLCTAAPSDSGSQGSFILMGHPLSLSYGVNLPSSLAEVIPITLGRLPPPTSVGLRYGHLNSNNEDFLAGRAQLN